ncbi:MAG: hypothetical protein ACI4EA_03430 [Candidatus Ornithomonoglobus sp.]
MKKNKILATMMTSIMVTGMMSGCTFNPRDNIAPALYGAPPTELKPPVINDVPTQTQSGEKQ